MLNIQEFPNSDQSSTARYLLSEERGNYADELSFLISIETPIGGPIGPLFHRLKPQQPHCRDGLASRMDMSTYWIGA